MKFVRSELLYLIWIIPFLVFAFYWGIRKRNKILSDFSSKKGLDSIAPGTDNGRRWLKAAFLAVAAVLIIIALTGPQYGFKWKKIERRGVDIIVAIDCSRSMLAADIEPNRLERAKREVYDLLSMLEGDRIGLVAFSGTAFLQCPLTLDYSGFNIFLKALSPDFLPVGGTNIPAAVNTAINGFNSKGGSEKAVILITDGGSTSGDPIEAAKKAQKAGVKLFCIGVGSKEGVPVPDPKGGFKRDASGNIVMTKLDEKTLQKMTLITGGGYVRSIAGDMDLDTIYKKEIRGKMKKATLSSTRKQVWEDRFQWPLFPAILLLIIELFIPARKKSIVPIILALLVLVSPAAQSRAESLHKKVQSGIESYKKGDYNKALKYFIDAQLNAPDDPRTYFNLGNAYYKEGKYDQAKENFAQALKTKDKKLKEKALYNLGNSEFRLENHKEAGKNYEKALKIDPKDIWAKQNLEFVKKIIKKKKQNKSDKKKDKKKGNNKKDKKGSNNKDKPRDKNKDQNKKGKSKNKSDKNREKKNNNKSPENKKQQAGNKKNIDHQKTKGKPGENQQGQRLLNRLKDMPGKAMVPAYEKQRIEKDW